VERFRLTFAKIRNEKNHVVRILCRANSIERECHEREMLQAEASIDPLTGIYNRLAGERFVTQYLSDMPEGITAAFLLIDLDHFKPINDTYGHQAGDQVLRNTAQRLRDFFRDHDIVFRLGGDEFIVLLKQISFSALTVRIDAVMHQPEDPAPAGPTVTFSMGAVLFDKQNSHYETLYHAADRSLYQAKKDHRTRIIQLVGSQAKTEL